MCCSEECYEAYMKQVHEARANKQFVDLLPDRLDMNKKEVKELIEKPYEEVVSQTKEELVDYIEDVEMIGLGATIDKINKEISQSNYSETDTDNETSDNKRTRRAKRNQEWENGEMV